MIKYRFIREKELLLKYAGFLEKTEAAELLIRNTIETAKDATIIRVSSGA